MSDGARPSLAERIAQVRSEITRAAVNAGREPRAIRLVCVSKTHPAARIREAFGAGERDFGESYAQELRDKAEELADLTDISWHFIGHVQSNKAKHVARAASVVHSVDGEGLARELAKRVAALGRAPLAVLLEVHNGIEAQKSGVASEDVPRLVEIVQSLPELELRGLMTMPPIGDSDVARRTFERLSTLRDAIGATVLPELSMGMSDDMDVAIASGATIVRVGTAIFGDR